MADNNKNEELEELKDEIEKIVSPKSGTKFYKWWVPIIFIIVALILSILFISNQLDLLKKKNEAEKVVVTQTPQSCQLIIVGQQDDKNDSKAKIETLPATNTTISKVDHTDNALLYVSFLIIETIMLGGSFALLIKALISEKETSTKFNDLKKELIKEYMMWKITRVKKNQEINLKIKELAVEMVKQEQELELSKRKFNELDKVKKEFENKQK